MNTHELSKLIKEDKKYNNFVIDKLEKVGEKFNCILKQKSSFSSRGFYVYSFKEGNTELEAIEGVIINAKKLGEFTEIEYVLKDTPKKEKQSKKKKEDPDETTSSSI